MQTDSPADVINNVEDHIMLANNMIEVMDKQLFELQDTNEQKKSEIYYKKAVKLIELWEIVSTSTTKYSHMENKEYLMQSCISFQAVAFSSILIEIRYSNYLRLKRDSKY